MAVPTLPTELYEHIFQFLAPSAIGDSAVFALAQCTATSEFVRSIAGSNLLWKPHYDIRYRTNDALKDAERHASCKGRYFDMYRLRRVQDRKALDTLDAIIRRTQGRASLGQVIAYDLGLDVYDALASEAIVRWPQEIVKPGEQVLDEVTPDWISRPYWAREALGVITRLEALRLWRKAVLFPGYTTLAQGFAAFSGFRGISPPQVLKDITALCERCEVHLKEQAICLEAGNANFDVIGISTAICAWMRAQGFEQAIGVNYHRMDNHFLDCVLTTNKQTLPLSLVILFVTLARHVGLDAHAVGFPQHVHAMVRQRGSTNGTSSPSPWEVEDFVHLDIYHSAERLVLPLPHLISLLEGMGVSNQAQQAQFLRAATVRDMCVRAASNIQHSFHLELDALANPNSPRFAYIRDCVHAAMNAFVMLASPGSRGASTMFLHMLNFIEESHRLDWCLLQKEVSPTVIGQHTSDLTSVQVRDQLQRLYAAEESDEAKVKRSEESLPLATDGTNVEFHVGTIMRHAKFAYIGVISEWNTKCEQPEQWMREMGVDSLSRGRDQPFYTVFAMDGTVRYVAEENVDLYTLPSDTWRTIRELLDNAKNIEMHFDRAEVGKNGVGRFIMGADLRRTFPGDAILCRKALDYDA